MRRAHANLWPEWAPERLWELIVDWAEWRTIAGQPKGLRLPQEAFGWDIQGGAAVAVRGPAFCLAPSTAPRQPSRVEEFNQAFAGLEMDQQISILVLVEHQDKAWPGGEEWSEFLTSSKITQRQYKTLLHDALRSLLALTKARGLA